LPDADAFTVTGLPAGVNVNEISVNQETSTTPAMITIALNQTEVGVAVAIPTETTISISADGVVTPKKMAVEGTPDIYAITVDAQTEGALVDSGITNVAILDAGQSHMTVGTVMSLSIAGVNSQATAFGVATDVASTAEILPLGIAAQSLSVSTNVPQGYVLSVFANHTPASAQGQLAWSFGSTDKSVFAEHEWADVPLASRLPDASGWACQSREAVNNAQCLVLIKTEAVDIASEAVYANEMTYLLVPRY
jgi:hypothetical protein